MTEQKRYSSTDFYTAAVLISQGFEVLDVTPLQTNQSTKVFHFEETEELHRIRKAYANGKLEGNIKVFKNAIETVKDYIHS